MCKSVLIIGGTGVLSSAVTLELIKRKYNVTMINRGNRVIPPEVTLIKCDCKDTNTIRQNLDGKKYDAIIDFLCYTKNQLIDSFNLYSKYTEQYFFISSSAVYNTSLQMIFTEDSPKVLSEYQYSIDKYEAEKALLTLSENCNCKYTIIRPSVTYGDTRIPYGIAPVYGYHWTLIARIKAGKPIITWNEGSNKVNMLRVEDFAVGVVGLIGNENAYNQAYNICGDEAPSFKDVLNILSNYSGYKLKTIDISPDFYAKNYPSRKDEILRGRSFDSINNNAKIKSIVSDFKQTIFITEGVKKTLKAYELNGYQKGIDWNFDACTDRIIKKWCKKQKIDYKSFNLRFIDYLGNANNRDKFMYFKELHKDNVIISIFAFANKIIKKVVRKK